MEFNSRIIYSAPQSQFFKDVLLNKVVGKMVESSAKINFSPGKPELNSWNNNVRHVKDLIELSEVNDTYVTFEYFIPYSRKRIDCVLYGQDKDNKKNVVHIELKQWSNTGVKESDTEGNFMTSDEEPTYTVNAFTGGAYRIVPHPSQQVKGYQGYLTNFVETVSSHEVSLTGMAYCYNYFRDSTLSTLLFDDKYKPLLNEFPTYAADDVEALAKDLYRLLGNGQGLSVFNKMMSSPIRPSMKLLEEVSTMIENADPSAFSLIEDQIVARNIIRDKIKLLSKNKNQKSVILVKGGPGTGKTVIALHLIAEMAKSKLNVHYATKSKPLLEGVRTQLKPNSRVLFSNVGSFIPYSTEENSIDVLFVDEAHRILKSANTQFTKAVARTDLSQIDTLVRSAKVSVFFIDDRQAIRGVEIGSSELIRECAARWNAKVDEVELVSQFRCNGSDNYLNWIEQVLYNQEIKSVFDKTEYDFQVFDDPQKMYDALCVKNAEQGVTARLTAGFCWPWTNHLVDGKLVSDVQIGDFAMPWETHEKITSIPKGYVRWYEWAYKPEGIKQVGCIYTAQGFEFDYVGVIIGEDFRYNEITKQIFTDKSACQDRVLRQNRQGATMTFDDYVRNIYRVLMSRGMKGCYVYCCDPALSRHLKSLIDEMPTFEIKAAELLPEHTEEPMIAAEEIHEEKELIVAEVEPEKQYTEYLPLYSIRAACGRFGDGEPVEIQGWVKAEGVGRLNLNMYVVKAVGHSMEPFIHDGEYCVFRTYTGGSRQGMVVLAQHHSFYDSENQGAYSIKEYQSVKHYNPDGTWEHDEILLMPRNPEYTPIRISVEDSDDFRIVGEFVAKLEE